MSVDRVESEEIVDRDGSYNQNPDGTKKKSKWKTNTEENRYRITILRFHVREIFCLKKNVYYFYRFLGKNYALAKLIV